MRLASDTTGIGGVGHAIFPKKASLLLSEAARTALFMSVKWVHAFRLGNFLLGADGDGDGDSAVA
jgi:hypothetical protein